MESATAQAPLPGKKAEPIEMVPVDQIEPRNDATRNGSKIDYAKAQVLRNAGWPIVKIADELRCSKDAVYKHTTALEPAKAKPLEWNEDNLRRLGQTDDQEVKEMMK